MTPDDITSGHLIACRMDRLTPYTFRFSDDTGDAVETGEAAVAAASFGRVRIGMPGNPESGEVAALDIVGYLRKYNADWGMPVMTTSYRGLRSALREAAADPSIKGIFIRVDSPGGDAYGAHDLAMEIAAAAAKKPVVAWVDDISASAAYYLSSGATKIVSNAGGWIGSIGTIAVVDDWSKFFEDAGVKVTAVRSAPRKAPIITGAPVGESAIAEVQREVDALGNQFKAWVIGRRGLNTEQQAAALDGRLFPADEAARLGLVDVIGNDRAALQTLQELIMAGTPENPAAAAEEVPPENPPAENEEVTQESEAQPEEATEPTESVQPTPAPVKPVKASPPPAKAVAARPGGSVNALDDESLRAKFAASPELRREFGSPEVYAAYVRAEAEGRVRVQGTF